jgi:hypothetical protein
MVGIKIRSPRLLKTCVVVTYTLGVVISLCDVELIKVRYFGSDISEYVEFRDYIVPCVQVYTFPTGFTLILSRQKPLIANKCVIVFT